MDKQEVRMSWRENSRKWLAGTLLVMGWALRASAGDSCRLPSRQTDTLMIQDAISDITRIEVRHNLKGDVKVTDSKEASGPIRVEVVKQGASQSELNSISSRYRVFTGTPGGSIMTLYVDNGELSTSFVTIIGGAVAMVILLGIIIIAIWLYHKRTPQNSITGHGSHSSIASHGAHQYQRHQRAERDESPTSQSRSKTPVDVPTTRSQSGESHDTCSSGPPSPPLPPYPSSKDTTLQSSAKTKYGGVGSPRGLYRNTLVTFTLVAMVTVTCSLCAHERRADVVIFMPAIAKLRSIDIFFNDKYFNLMDTSEWSHKNSSRVNIIDLNTVGMSEDKPPCDSQVLCPAASRLASCDRETKRCYCQRGYKMAREKCIDVNECKETRSACPSKARCENAIGHHLCHCPLGYYNKGRSCVSCSTSCPVGQYEVQSCSSFADRVCRPCDKCPSDMYEVKPCDGGNNHHCIHPAHPVVMDEGDTLPVFVEGLKVASSSNVFLDDLHNTQALLTSVYITNNKQSQDFIFYRKSVRLNIGLSMVQILPEFEDVSHVSDNAFVEQGESLLQLKDDLRRIRRNHCRNPIPDSYKLYLEIIKDRTTRAARLTCTSELSRQGGCPYGIHVGEQFINRTLNDDCPRQGTTPREIRQLSNNIICMDGHSLLLQQIFGVETKPVRAITFPPRSCREPETACDNCLKGQQCFHSGERCCNGSLECLAKTECKVKYSDECYRAATECALGDAYEFTLEPSWANLGNEFQCHIRQRKPEFLYTLWFYVTAMDSDFETPRVHRRVNRSDVQSLVKDLYNFEFLTIEHITGVDLQEEFILRGQHLKDERWNYTLHPLKQPSEYLTSSINVHNVAGVNSVKVAQVQFDEPFGYSTTSWARGNDCNKNITKFKPPQNHYKESVAPQHVSVITETVRAPYVYTIRSKDRPPEIRISAPANVSFVSWWFRDKEPHLLTDETLTSWLNLSSDGRVWEIHIQGMLSGCPGYVGITISNHEDMEELFKYDAVISCPPEFNLTFSIPNWGSQNDKTYHVLLDDAKIKYQMFLTNLALKEPARDLSLEAASDEIVHSAMMMEGAATDSHSGMFVLVAITITAAIIFGACFIGLELTRKITPTKYAHMAENEARKPASSCFATGSGYLTPLRCFFIVLYAIGKVIYSFVFTFSMFFLIVPLCMQQDMETVASLHSIELDSYARANTVFDSVERHAQQEILRQLDVTEHMQGACNHYLEDMMSLAIIYIANGSSPEALNAFVHQEYSITSILQRKYNQLVEQQRVGIDSFNSSYKRLHEQTVGPAIQSFGTYLKSLYGNGWLHFPETLFNTSHGDSTEYSDFTDQHAVSIEGVVPEFGKFLGLTDVFNVQMWPVKFWERYRQMLPALEELDIGPAALLTCPIVDEQRLNGKLNYTKHHMNSSHFYAASVFPDTAAQLNQSPAGMLSEIGFNPIDIFADVDWTVLRLLFLVLDILMLVYRLSHLSLCVAKLRYGFQESVEITPELMKKEASRPQEQAHADASAFHTTEWTEAHQLTLDASADTCQTLLKDTEVAYCSNNAVVTLPDKSTHKVNGDVARGPEEASSSPPGLQSINRATSVILSLLSKLICSEIIPKAVIICAVLALTISIYRIVVEYVQLDIIMFASGLSHLLINMNFYLDDASSYLDVVASHITQSLLSWYPAHTKAEMHEFNTLIEGFKKEQYAWLESYREEVCHLLNTANNTHCGASVSSPFNYSLPVLPCNFIPVQAHHFPDTEYIQLEEELVMELLPVVTSFQSLLTVLLQIIVGVTAAIILLHLLGSLLLQVVRCRGMVPVQTVYVLSSLVGVNIRAPMRAYSQEQPPGDTSNDNEDAESHGTMTTPFDCTPGTSPSLRNLDNTPNLLYPRTLHMTPTQSYSTSSLGSRKKHSQLKAQSEDSTDTSAQDIGFSETKV